MPDGNLQADADAPPLDMRKPDIALTIPATQEAVRRAMLTVRQALRTHDLNDPTLGSLEIVLAETCNNIVEHAYENSGKGVIAIAGRCMNGLILFEFFDTGRPMPGLEPPLQKTHDLDAFLDDLPEGGFGWGLIRDMTSSLIYRRHAGRNMLRLTVDVQP